MPNPKRIGGYRILSEIGSGGFGAVYRARDPLSDRDVALKALTKIANPGDLARFRRETRLAHQIDHPNVMRALHCGEDGGACFIVMELMPISLREILARGRLSLSRSLDICRQAALGLRAAHERGVVHGGVKPENILLDSAGEVKVSDFGLAPADGLRTTAAAGSRVGAPLYASPERRKGERPDVRSDVYSLGAVLREALAGEAPSAASGKAPPIKRIRPDVPTGLARIVRKCAEPNPKRRYQTMDELIESVTADLVNRCALADFHEAAGGRDWERRRGWLTNAPLGEWHGIDATRSGVVVEFKTLSEIAHLTELESLDLRVNGLSGSLSPELGYLTELKSLDLGSNRLSGSVPPELARLTELEALYLRLNRYLSGNIPPELGSLAKLERLDLEYNRLSGSIPPELGGLTELKDLFLSGNRLVGNIPPELGNLAKLERLNLGNNRLFGRAPPELGNLTRLRLLHLANNSLFGSVPPELCSLTKLEYLTLSGNDWTGCIPRALLDIPHNDLHKIDLPVCDG